MQIDSHLSMQIDSSLLKPIHLNLLTLIDWS